MRTLMHYLVAGCLLCSLVFFTNNDEASAQKFIDVPASNAHATNIERLTSAGIINGYGNGNFGLEDPILREQAILLIYKILKDDKEIVRTYKSFKDVKTTDYSYEAIKWGYETGILDGSDGKFNPKQYVTREQMAKILVTAFDLKTSTQSTIADVPNKSWSYTYVNTLNNNGLTKLYKNQFYPSQMTKRGEMASFLVRAIDYVGIELKEPVNDAPVDTAEPIDTVTYESGWNMKWKVAQNDGKLELDGYTNGQLTAQYVKGAGKTLEGITIGMTKAKVQSIVNGKVPNALAYKNGNYTNAENQEKIVFETATRYVTVFLDIHENNVVTSILAVDKSLYSKKPYYYPNSAALQKSYEDLMIVLMNQSRAEHGLQPLKNVNDTWSFIARNHSLDMINRNYFDHTSPDGVEFWQRMQNAGLNYSYANENLAMGLETVIHAHEGLMNSLGHRQNILSSKVKNAYVGVMFDNENKPYFTVNMFTELQ